VHWLQTPDDLDPAWIRESDTVGITAGTSTPDSVIEAIETALKGLPSRKDIPQTDAA
jgi:4-hydroxy-3-methylbut-2-enyl diphosphate reductase